MPIKPKLKITKLYFPGFISLACLPLLFVFNMVFTGKFDRLHVMEIGSFIRPDILKYDKIANAKFPLTLLQSKAKFTYRLNTINAGEIVSKIYNITNGLGEKQQSGLLIKISFTPQTRYNDFVSVFDACNRLGNSFARVYFEDNLFVWKSYSKEHVIPQIRPIPIDEGPISIQPQLSFMEKLESKLMVIKPMKQLMPSLLLLILMYGLHFSGKGTLQIPAYRKRTMSRD